MANLKNDDIRRLAKLARLKLADEEVELLTAQLSDILKYVEQLKATKTGNLEPTSQVTGLVNVTRSDEDTTDTIPRSALMDQTPQTDGKNLKVPKVI